MGLFEELGKNVKESWIEAGENELRGNFVSSSINKNNHGCIVMQTVYDNSYVETVITAPETPYSYDYVQQTEQIKKSTQFHVDLEE